MSLNKLQSYDNATKKLMGIAMDLPIKNSTQFSLPEMVFLLRESFKYRLTYKRVFPDIPRANHTEDPATGYCLVSSYFIYEHTGGDDVWTLMGTPIHWWLLHKETGTTFDITYTQFKRNSFDYNLGKPDTKMQNDPMFARMVHERAMRLGNATGIE